MPFPPYTIVAISAAILLSGLVSGFVLPAQRFGEPASNVLIFVGPQLLTLVVVYFVPPNPHPAFLAGVAWALLMTMLLFTASIFIYPPENFMVAMVYWFALGSVAATALMFRFLLPHLGRIGSSQIALGSVTAILSVAGGALLVWLFIIPG
jgi:hypothetical protein